MLPLLPAFVCGFHSVLVPYGVLPPSKTPCSLLAPGSSAPSSALSIGPTAAFEPDFTAPFGPVSAVSPNEFCPCRRFQALDASGSTGCEDCSRALPTVGWGGSRLNGVNFASASS